MIVYRLIAIDLDGTLLHDDGTVSDRTIQYLNNLMRNYIIVFITGRNCKDAYRVTQLFNNEYIDKYIIYDDGQTISKIGNDGNYNVLYESPILDKSIVQNIALWAQKMKYDYVVLSDNIFTFNNSCNIFKYAILKMIYLCRQKFISRKFNKKILENNNVKKIKIINFGKDCVDSVLNDVRVRFSDQYSVINDGEIEIKNSFATKLTAIKKILSILQIEDDNCFYFGNGGNDEECLRYFSNSYAVSNAAERIIMAARNVIPSNNDDGVYQTLKEIVEERI